MNRTAHVPSLVRRFAATNDTLVIRHNSTSSNFNLEPSTPTDECKSKCGQVCGGVYDRKSNYVGQAA
jgi:hypothetical protein